MLPTYLSLHLITCQRKYDIQVCCSMNLSYLSVLHAPSTGVCLYAINCTTSNFSILCICVFVVTQVNSHSINCICMGELLHCHSVYVCSLVPRPLPPPRGRMEGPGDKASSQYNSDELVCPVFIQMLCMYVHNPSDELLYPVFIRMYACPYVHRHNRMCHRKSRPSLWSLILFCNLVMLSC